MKPTPLAAAALLAAAVCASAQQKPAEKSASAAAAAQTPPSTQATTAAAVAKGAVAPALSSPIELARATYAAQGGDKYRDLKNIVLLGSADLYAPGSAQSLSGKFGMITSGDRLRLEVQSPLFGFSLVSDGVRTYSSMRGFELPSASRFGVPVLLKFEQPGYAVTALDGSKKERAFRITDPEGNITDFYVDPATNRLMRFEVPYGPYTYSVEFKSMKEIEGVFVPMSFVQRISSTQGSFYAEFKVKDAKINQEVPDNTFVIPDK
ncbi:MAG TPA: hypothetical protein VM864_13310 [Pyrinomonadaceae bacterium]|nr:hypothetical protein [Pyrinomonadaceae bacterium]